MIQTITAKNKPRFVTTNGMDMEIRRIDHIGLFCYNNERYIVKQVYPDETVRLWIDRETGEIKLVSNSVNQVIQFRKITENEWRG